jgi:hypothetical protein
MTEDSESQRIEELIKSFVDETHLELIQRWEKWTIDLSENEIYEVVGALLARQVTLAIQIAQCPQIWNGHIAPIILRAMADVFISLAWVLKDPLDRSRKFILYGLGQAVLQLEHRKAQIVGREPSPEEKQLLEASEEWINSQRFSFLVDVSVGSWSGIPTRQMAEEAGFLDFYNYVYNPFSACTHSMWHHVARYNLIQCANPLHKYHKVPADPELPTDLHNFYLAGKYLEKTFRVFDEKFSIQIEIPSAHKHLCEGLNKIFVSTDVERETGKSARAETENTEPDLQQNRS